MGGHRITRAEAGMMHLSTKQGKPRIACSLTLGAGRDKEKFSSTGFNGPAHILLSRTSGLQDCKTINIHLKPHNL